MPLSFESVSLYFPHSKFCRWNKKCDLIHKAPFFRSNQTIKFCSDWWFSYRTYTEDQWNVLQIGKSWKCTATPGNKATCKTSQFFKDGIGASWISFGPAFCGMLHSASDCHKSTLRSPPPYYPHLPTPFKRTHHLLHCYYHNGSNKMGKSFLSCQYFPTEIRFFFSWLTGACALRTHLGHSDAAFTGQLLLRLFAGIRIAQMGVEVLIQNLSCLLTEVTPLSPTILNATLFIQSFFLWRQGTPNPSASTAHHWLCTQRHLVCV